MSYGKVEEPSSSRSRGTSTARRSATSAILTATLSRSDRARPLSTVNPRPRGQWMPVTLARVLIGIFFCISGGTKLFVKAQFGVLEQTMVQIHVPFPHATALFVATVEFACGAGLALGLLTPLSAAILTGDMIVAIASRQIHTIRASGVLAWLDDF